MGGIQIKKYNGSAWVDGAVKKYNGSSWVDGYTYKWNGSAWVQIYPDTFVSVSNKSVTGSSTTWTYRAKVYKNWKQEDAKQGSGGNYSNSGGSGDSNHYGFLNLSSNKFTGHGDVNSVSSASYTAKRGGAGTYNKNQTIKFYRGNVVPTSPSSASPVDTLSGNFTCTTGSNVGSGGTMSNRSITGLDNFKNWMNGVSSKPQLYISSTASADYLSIKGASTVKASYVYRADVITYVPSGGGAAVMSLRSPSNTYSTRTTTTSFGSGSVLKKVQSTVDDAYHTMVIYPEEKNMTLDEIVAYRTENNLPDISINDILTDYVKQPVIKDFKIDHDNHMVKVQLDGLQDGHIPEYSIDGDNYYLMSSPSVDIYTGDLTSEFDKNRDYVYIRVRNEITDSIDLEYIEEPLFLVV